MPVTRLARHQLGSESFEGESVEVKIGVRNATRELILESAQSPDEVHSAVMKALKSSNGVLELTDERGRQVVVIVEHLMYVDIGESEERRVGFGL